MKDQLNTGKGILVLDTCCTHCSCFSFVATVWSEGKASRVGSQEAKRSQGVQTETRRHCCWECYSQHGGWARLDNALCVRPDKGKIHVVERH